MLLQSVTTYTWIKNHKLELKFTFPLSHVSELIVMGDGKYSVAIEKFGVVRNTIQKQ